MERKVSMGEKEYIELYYLTMKASPRGRTLSLFFVFLVLNLAVLAVVVRAVFLQNSGQLVLNCFFLLCVLAFSYLNLSSIFRGRRKIKKLIQPMFAAGELEEASACYTFSDKGIRLSEKKHLRWSDIAAVRTDKKSMVFYTKNQKGAYYVPYDRELAALLKTRLSTKQIVYVI